MFLVTFDHLDGCEMILEGHGFNPETADTAFRLYDDDGILYYSGILTDDEFGDAQILALIWGRQDAGCTTIKVSSGDGKWEQVIG